MSKTKEEWWATIRIAPIPGEGPVEHRISTRYHATLAPGAPAFACGEKRPQEFLSGMEGLREALARHRSGYFSLAESLSGHLESGDDLCRKCLDATEAKP